MKLKNHSPEYPQPLVGVILLNWNGAADTIDCLASLLSATYEPLLIVVVDNASTDDSVGLILGWLVQQGTAHHVVDLPGDLLRPSALDHEVGVQVVLVRADENLGFCRGNNLGMEQAFSLGASFSLVLNNDTVVSPDFLEPMVCLGTRNQSVGLVGGIITYFDQPDTIWWAGGQFNRFFTAKRILDRQPLSALEKREPFSTEWISGCMMMIPIHVYRELGGFAEEYFIWSEEWDYSRRVAEAGYKLMVAPDSRIRHKIGHSLGIMKPLNYYYGLRNGLLFKRKMLRWYVWYPYLAQYLVNRVIRFTQLFLQGRKDLVHAGTIAVWDYLVGRTGKWSRQES